MSDEFDDLNPFAGENGEADMQYYETLVALNVDGELEPLLAEEMPEHLGDGVWEVTLREGITYHDGSSLDGEALAAAIDLIIQDEVYQAGAGFKTMSAVEVVGPLAVRIETTPADAILDRRLAGLHIVKADNPDLGESPIGTGPYQLGERVPGQRTVLERYPDYWGEVPDVDEIEYRVIPDRGAQLAALQAGEIDVVRNLVPEDVDRVPRVEEVESGDYMFVVLNTTGPLSDVRVRQALNHAIDLPAIQDALYGGTGEILACQMFREGALGFNPALESYPYDPDKARELIDEAGAGGASVELVASDGRYFRDRETAEVLVAAWNEVGLNATLSIEAGDRFLNRLYDSQFDGLLIRRSPEVLDGSNLEGYYAEEGNQTAHDLSELSDLMKAGIASTDVDEREEIFQEMNRVACEEAAVVVLLAAPVLVGTSERVASLNMPPMFDDANARISQVKLN